MLEQVKTDLKLEEDKNIVPGVIYNLYLKTSDKWPSCYKFQLIRAIKTVSSSAGNEDCYFVGFIGNN
ncbi:MAG: hypothetical protein CMQ41_10485 [Gammaproteobacteria bacterium]|nr:hypothetical protein [Gammaproteobacteria bacterium]